MRTRAHLASMMVTSGIPVSGRTAGPGATSGLAQAGNDLWRQPDPPRAVGRRLDTIQQARLTPIRDRRYRHIEQIRGDARGATTIRPVAIGARPRLIRTSSRD